MSTNALVVVPDGEGSWKGTYVHWDGYQLHKELVPILKRDGIAKALSTLFAHTWSSLHHGYPTEEAIKAATPVEVPGPDNFAGYLKSLRESGICRIGIPGFGEPNGNISPEGDMALSTPESYVGWPEYLYKITADTLYCYKMREDDLKLIREIKWEVDDPDLSDFDNDDDA